MGGLLTTSPRTRIELKMNGGRGQCPDATKWIQTHGTYRHHTGKRYDGQRETVQEVKGMNECGIRKLSEPKRPANFCGGLLRSLLAPRSQSGGKE